MASIMPFPNKATHRRMPHLQNTPKPTPPITPLDSPLHHHLTDADSHTMHIKDQESIQLAVGPNGTKGLLLDSQRHGEKNPRADLLLEDSKDHDHEKGLKPDNSQHLVSSRPTSPLGSPMPTASAPSLSSHDSKLIKTALYDAFGCLHHPSAHTKHSLAATAAALRSGDVTPLKGSPSASPLLRPVHLRSSTPITPLELSDEASAPGYFALHSSSTSASPTLAGSSSSPMSPPHGKHHRQGHGSSHLSATYTSTDDDFSVPDSGNWSPLSLSRRSSINPVEHPVLSSLQTLSITHPHPPEHYHPHLGHDLGHDKVPILISPAQAVQVAEEKSEKSKIVVAETTPKIMTFEDRGLQPTFDSTVPSSPFPMDQSSIHGFHSGQDLV
ncbi:hypothetical protein EMPS_05669 [Entomortierella parvispora]|uniref:Uncharacterized protein n=1 Tax=Entomortierella parvispora TaxID=205924 RepID=A0A9P3HAV1_9FUNG|nr:hypothetical protein EMPS_05669 [Entomortierella parvispora]